MIMVDASILGVAAKDRELDDEGDLTSSSASLLLLGCKRPRRPLPQTSPCHLLLIL